jgi:hypothetical protein
MVAEMSKQEAQGKHAEAVFCGFLAFMMVMAISTIFLFGATATTLVASGCGSVGLFSLVWRAIH